jgi:hypothetical protein
MIEGTVGSGSSLMKCVGGKRGFSRLGLMLLFFVCVLGVLSVGFDPVFAEGEAVESNYLSYVDSQGKAQLIEVDANSAELNDPQKKALLFKLREDGTAGLLTDGKLKISDKFKTILSGSQSSNDRLLTSSDTYRISSEITPAIVNDPTVSTTYTYSAMAGTGDASKQTSQTDITSWIYTPPKESNNIPQPKPFTYTQTMTLIDGDNTKLSVKRYSLEGVIPVNNKEPQTVRIISSEQINPTTLKKISTYLGTEPKERDANSLKGIIIETLNSKGKVTSSEYVDTNGNIHKITKGWFGSVTCKDCSPELKKEIKTQYELNEKAQSREQYKRAAEQWTYQYENSATLQKLEMKAQTIQKISQGFSGFAPLFMSKESLAKWANKADQLVRPFSTDGLVDKLCKVKIDQASKSVAFVEQPNQTLAPAATIAAECGLATDDFSGNTLYLYKITSYVTSPIGIPDETPLKFQIKLYGEREVYLTNRLVTLNPGESFSLDRSNQIKYSPYNYTKICLEFQEPPTFFESERLCNIITCVEPQTLNQTQIQEAIPQLETPNQQEPQEPCCADI